MREQNKETLQSRCRLDFLTKNPLNYETTSKRSKYLDEPTLLHRPEFEILGGDSI